MPIREMKILVPKDNEQEARFYLEAWLNLHEGEGLGRAQRAVSILGLVSAVAGAAFVAGLILGWHSYVIGLTGVVLGYAGAEAAALKSRLRSWPHNEKYFDWDAIRAALGKRPS